MSGKSTTWGHARSRSDSLVSFLLQPELQDLAFV